MPRQRRSASFARRAAFAPRAGPVRPSDLRPGPIGTFIEHRRRASRLAPLVVDPVRQLTDAVDAVEVARILGVSRRRVAELADTADFPRANRGPGGHRIRLRDFVERWALGHPRQEQRGPRGSLPTVIRGRSRAGHLDVRRAGLALTDLVELPLRRAPHRPLLARCWELRENLTVYDAAYVALAEVLDVVLLTADARLANAPGPRCEIELLA